MKMSLKYLFNTLQISLLANSFATSALSQSHGNVRNDSDKKPEIAIIFASDGRPMQASIDFYRASYKALSGSTEWQPMPMSTIRTKLEQTGVSEALGGIPTVDRKLFRASLPKNSSDGSMAGKSVDELQRFLDSTRTSALIIADCARQSRNLLKACALYYYDRVQGKVLASVVKRFNSGTSDASMWAEPLLKTLERGIAAAQRQKDQAVIEELIARNQEDLEDSDRVGLFALYGSGDNATINLGLSGNSVNLPIAGGGLELGFLRDNVGAYLEVGRSSWSGSKSDLSSLVRLNYGLGMIFRANALESLLWYLELSAGKEQTTVNSKLENTQFNSEGLYTRVAPGIGLEISEAFSLSLSLGWRWYFENSRNGSGLLNEAGLEGIRTPSVMFRGMILL
jgi:hypothetical protein